MPTDSPTGDILIVDDEPGARMLFKMMCERKLNVTTREAGDGQEALDLARQMLPRLIILDLMMPVMDGFTFMKHLHNDAALSGTPVLVFSAALLEDSEKQQLGIPLENIIRKGSLKVSQIRELVNNMLTEQDTE